MNNLIQFSKHISVPEELVYVSEVLKSGYTCGDGVFTKRATALLAKQFPSASIQLTTSCTHALELCALLLDLKPGDEVIMPSFTFVSTANAFLLRGAKPVFVDIRPDTLNIDEHLIEQAISTRTKAIVVVHYAGVACEMDEIVNLARRHNLCVIEDNAHGLFGSYKDTALGSIGTFSALSFHHTKNISCGEGGTLMVNDKSYAQRAEIIREKGTDRVRFFRGEVDKYSWVDLGSSYLPSDILAAVLTAQLESAQRIQELRAATWNFYNTHLAKWCVVENIQLPFIPHHCQHPSHIFYLLMPSLQQRQRFISHMRECGVQTAFHYVPLHKSKMGAALGYSNLTLVHSESISDRLVRLPLHAGLNQSDVEYVVECATSFRTGE